VIISTYYNGWKVKTEIQENNSFLNLTGVVKVVYTLLSGGFFRRSKVSKRKNGSLGIFLE